MVSVEDKMTMMEQKPNKKNAMVMVKKMGMNNADIRYLGKTNNKIRRRMGF